MSARPEEAATAELARPDRGRGLSLCVIAPDSVTSHPLPEAGRVVVGRSSECTIALDVASISRRHVALSIGVSITVEDLGSSNGTLVRGQRLPAGRAQPIRPYEVFEIGALMLMVEQHGGEREL